MQKVTTIVELREVVKKWRKQGQKIAFVPTMGNLHAGHIKLVSEAREKADKVIVSIFVNPTQFGESEDFELYPRTEIEDETQLIAVAADLLFLPAVFEIYPNNANTVVSAGALAKHHCGAHRPGHFDGVATVVTKLFNMVQPDSAFFGEKDFQQLTIIRKMVEDLNMPIDIIGVATERESGGLAMSSRNGFLTDNEKRLAPKLYQALVEARDEILQGKADYSAIEKQQLNLLDKQGFNVDYFSICRADSLLPATVADKNIVILVAAKLGKPRLIDNIYFVKS